MTYVGLGWGVGGLPTSRRKVVQRLPSLISFSLGCPALWLSVLLRNATPSVLHQRHIGRVLRSSCNVRGRRVASSRAREPRPGRCPRLWPGDLRNDGGSVAAAGADGIEA